MLAVVHEVFRHRRAGVGGDVLQRGGGARSGNDHGGVVHGTVALEDVDGHGHRRILLPHRHIKTLHAAVFLVDDRIDADGGLARLAVADDQLTLAAADRRHGVDCFDAGLQRLADGRPLGHAGGKRFHRAAMGGDDGALAIERVAERVEHAADHRLSNRHAEQFAGAAHLVPFGDLQIVAEDDHADRVFLEVEREAGDATGELDHFSGHHAGQAPHARNAVAHFEHAADFADVNARFVAADLLTEYRGDLVCIEFHGCSSASGGSRAERGSWQWTGRRRCHRRER